jgi:pheromone shutdown protein TraB
MNKNTYMNQPEDNPYPKIDTALNETPISHKNSFLRGFFLGWCIMIISLALLTLCFWSMEDMIKRIFGYHFNWLFAIIPASIIGTSIWFAIKRRYRSVSGVMTALISMILFVPIFVSAIFALLKH